VLDGVLLDTSFVIRLLKTNDALHPNAKAWFRQLLERRVPMYLSTISIA
jgi:predicted nucleic acid-binding protein